MNENDQAMKNQDSTPVQSSETNLDNNEDLTITKTTPLEHEVVFVEKEVLPEDKKEEAISEPILQEENKDSTEFHTIKIDDSASSYDFYKQESNQEEAEVISTVENQTNPISDFTPEEKSEEKKEDIKSKFDPKTLIKNKWTYISIILISSVCFFAYVVSGIMSDTKEPENNNQNKQTQQEIKQTGTTNTDLVRRKLDGVLVKKEDANKWPFTTMIENSTDARPLSGVNDANIVYEALAEGSITRFLCIFDGSKQVDKIGPVRSARPYYVDIADEYSSLFIHFGGSPEALDRLSKGYYNVVDFDGIIYDGKYFWRDNNRQAPHNAYTSTDLINKFKSAIDKQDLSGNFSEWLFTDKKFNESIDKSNLKTANNAYIQYSDQTTRYNLNWKYDAQNDEYIRYYEDQMLDKDSLNNKITTKNIIIQFASTSVTDEKLRKDIDLTEGGKAIMIRNGYYVEGYWKKNSLINRTKFYIKTNNIDQEFEFNPGKTWVNIVPKDYKIKID